ncbi:hypothetical protein FHY55_10670 [Oceanicola sp. D3]|uniref:hypothetical protein n=1 Tax=Oceanicola sp. D3 TaxID=2587163 RepID=UPI00111FEDC5|nr:hypothetical protein [Oceanicola sp. D3]QDC09679.1 hypothetical protein FHY55_10670 [Oceanicola sp. D3]
MHWFAGITLALCSLTGPMAQAQGIEAEGTLAVLLDLPVGEAGAVLGELDAAWRGSRIIGRGPGPVTEGDPWFWSAVFQTPGMEATPRHGLTLTCSRHGHESHRAMIAARTRGLRPWPGGAVARLTCEGAGVFWGRNLGPLILRGAQDMLETWAVDTEPGQPGHLSYRGGDTAPRGGRMVGRFRLDMTRAGGALPGSEVWVEVEIYRFGSQ